MFFAKKILIIDNDVLVNFVEYFFDNIPKVLSHLLLEYSYIFIPGTILNEFLRKKDDKKRKKIINGFFDNFQNLIKCPVNVAKHELLLFPSDFHEGEADAFMQIKKLEASDKHIFESIEFLTSDNGAIRYFKKQNVDVLEYKDLINKLKELGLILPR